MQNFVLLEFRMELHDICTYSLLVNFIGGGGGFCFTFRLPNGKLHGYPLASNVNHMYGIVSFHFYTCKPSMVSGPTSTGAYSFSTIIIVYDNII